MTVEQLMHQIDIHLGKKFVLTDEPFSVNGNVSYVSTDNLENIFNNSENNNYNQFLGLGVQTTVDTNTNNYFGTNNTSYDNLGGYYTNNTKTTKNYGLGQYKSHYIPSRTFMVLIADENIKIYYISKLDVNFDEL